MAEVNTFKLGTTSITVTDSTARSNASTALQTATDAKSAAEAASATATAASTTANEAKTTAESVSADATAASNGVTNLYAAGPFNVKYDSGTKTITFTQITKG